MVLSSLPQVSETRRDSDDLEVANDDANDSTMSALSEVISFYRNDMKELYRPVAAVADS